MRWTAAMLLAAALAALPSGAPRAAGEAWDGAFQAPAEWGRASFVDELRGRVEPYCRAADCCPTEDSAETEVPLYSLTKAVSPDVAASIDYFEARRSPYTLVVSRQDGRRRARARRDGLALPLVASPPCYDRDAVPLTSPSDKQRIVVALLKDDPEPQPPPNPLTHLALTPAWARSSDDFNDERLEPVSAANFQNTRLLPIEVVLTEAAGLVEGVTDTAACGECGRTGSFEDYRSGNFVRLNPYAASLREKLRAAAEADLREDLSDPRWRTLFTRHEAGFLYSHLRRSSAFDRRHFFGAIRQASRLEAEERTRAYEALVDRWRTYYRFELTLYLQASAGLRGEVPGRTALSDAEEARVEKALKGEDLAALFAAAGLSRPAVAEDSDGRVDDAAKRILEGCGGEDCDD